MHPLNLKCASLDTFWQNETRCLVTGQRIQEALPTLSFSPHKLAF